MASATNISGVGDQRCPSIADERKVLAIGHLGEVARTGTVVAVIIVGAGGRSMPKWFSKRAECRVSSQNSISTLQAVNRPLAHVAKVADWGANDGQASCVHVNSMPVIVSSRNQPSRVARRPLSSCVIMP